MSLQIECLAPVIPQNGHKASTSTSPLSCFLSPGASSSSPFPLAPRWMSLRTFALVSRWLLYTRRMANKVQPVFVRIHPGLLLVFYAPECLLIPIWCLNATTPAAAEAIVLSRCVLFIIPLN